MTANALNIYEDTQNYTVQKHDFTGLVKLFRFIFSTHEWLSHGGYTTWTSTYFTGMILSCNHES